MWRRIQRRTWAVPAALALAFVGVVWLSLNAASAVDDLPIPHALRVATRSRPKADPSWQAREKCDACHPTQGRSIAFGMATFSTFREWVKIKTDDCLPCHVNNKAAAEAEKPAAWLPFSASTVARKNNFIQTPPLVFLVDTEGGEALPRFTDCGLRAYLVSPQKRIRSEQASMYAMPAERLERVLSGLDTETEPCQPLIGSHESGRHLFTSMGCAACHMDAAPNLLVGTPLLAKEYFRWRVRIGSTISPIFTASWRIEGQELVRTTTSAGMPRFPQLSESEIDDLYTFISQNRSTGTNPHKRITKNQAHALDTAGQRNGESDFQVFSRVILNGTCRHCHGGAEGARSNLAEVFAVKRPPTLFQLTDQAFQNLISPGPGCSRSEIEANLRRRHDEVKGDFTNRRGMPLTQPPVNLADVEAIARWSRDGCPSKQGYKHCRSCR